MNMTFCANGLSWVRSHDHGGKLHCNSYRCEFGCQLEMKVNLGAFYSRILTLTQLNTKHARTTSMTHRSCTLPKKHPKPATLNHTFRSFGNSFHFCFSSRLYLHFNLHPKQHPKYHLSRPTANPPASCTRSTFPNRNALIVETLSRH